MGQAPSRDEITGLILAGGRGSRMGGVDKGLVPLAGRPLVAWVLEALRPQVRAVLVSANRNQDRYAALGLGVLPDDLPGFQGPLAGIVRGLAAAVTPWVAVVPCDGPGLAPDLVARLAGALGAGDAVVAAAADGDQPQPVYALIPAGLGTDLRAYLDGGGRSILGWYARHRVAWVSFAELPGAFANINRPSDIEQVARRIGLADAD